MNDYKPILLVEDDMVDAMTIKRSLEDLKIANKLVHVTNGEEALNYLKNSGNKKPRVILLDLNMPKMNGIELLKILKSDKNMVQIPVIVVTTSTQQQDIIETFGLGVAGYIAKSASQQEFAEKLKMVQVYWSLSEAPSLR